MAIAKKPLKHTSDTRADRVAESFIEGVGRPRSQDRPRKVLISHRLDRELLGRIDAAARRRGISRAAWINFYLSKAAEEEAP